MEPGSFQLCPLTGPETWTQTETQEGHFEHQETLFTVKCVKHWPVLHNDVLEYPALEIFKSDLDMVLDNQFQIVLLEQGSWTRWPLEVPSKLNHSVIVWLVVWFTVVLRRNWSYLKLVIPDPLLVSEWTKPSQQLTNQSNCTFRARFLAHWGSHPKVGQMDCAIKVMYDCRGNLKWPA